MVSSFAFVASKRSAKLFLFYFRSASCSIIQCCSALIFIAMLLTGGEVKKGATYDSATSPGRGGEGSDKLRLDCLSVTSWGLVGTSSYLGLISNPRSVLDSSAQTIRGKVLVFCKI